MFRLLIVDNFQIRRDGKIRGGAGQRFLYGAIRNNWRVMTFSERDVTRYLAPLGFMRNIGAAMMNRHLLATARNFRPDLVLIGNCDYTSNRTIDAIHAALPKVKIAHVNVDPLWQAHTCGQVAARQHSCDAIFLTTAGEKLKTWVTGRNVVAYMPNPCDASIDGRLPAEHPRYDLFFAGGTRGDEDRQAFLARLLPQLDPSVRFGLFGSLGRPFLRGTAYEEALAASASALNLNRQEGWKWYSSDRIVHLMANGIATFLSDAGGFQDFFAPDREAYFFHDAADLAAKIAVAAADPARRLAVARAGRERYFRLFNAQRVLNYIRETVFALPYSEPYEWANEVYRHVNR